MNKTTSPDGKSLLITPGLSKFIENLGRYFESYGIPRIGGRILGLLLIAHEPLSAESISAILKVSRASISTNFRLLSVVGLAEKVSLPGDRTTYYVFPEAGFEKTVAVEIQSLSDLKGLAEQGLKALPSEDAARSRMEMLIRWTDFLVQVWQNALIEWREQDGSQSVVR
jgi:DNA-binding transcriptional regulator GbsR (MarR family)